MDVMDADVAGHRQPFLPRAADQSEAGRRRQTAQVHARRGARALLDAEAAQQLEERQQRDRLVDDRHRRQPEPRGHRPARGDAAATQGCVLRPPPDREAEGLRVLQRAQQHLRVGDRDVGLREADAARLAELGHLGQRDARETHRQRAEWMDLRVVQRPRSMLQHLHEAGLVERRIGIRRTNERRDAAGQRRVELGLERGPVLGARLAQPRRQVDEARAHHQTGRVERAARPEVVRRARLDDGDDATGVDEDVARSVEPGGRVDDAAVADGDLHAATFMRRSSCGDLHDLHAPVLTRPPAGSSPPSAPRCRR